MNVSYFAREDFATNQDVILKGEFIGKIGRCGKLHFHAKPAVMCVAFLLRAAVGELRRRNQFPADLYNPEFLWRILPQDRRGDDKGDEGKSEGTFHINSIGDESRRKSQPFFRLPCKFSENRYCRVPLANETR